MNLSTTYQWENQIATHLPSLNSWQHANLALFSIGMIGAKSAQQRAIALELQAQGHQAQSESLQRRLQRFLDNDALDVSAASRHWSRWVWEAMGKPDQWTVLVDETKLKDHLGVMMLGVAFEKRCIPLVWHCYRTKAYPRCGQVALIFNLLMHLKRVLPDHVDVLVLADRGIGTSPRLCRYIDEQLNWRYLFRVTCQSKILTDTGEYTIAETVSEGEYWAASGRVFKKQGRIPAHARAIWEDGYDEAWVLVTNDDQLTGREYAQRNWQEQGFRDLKSHGWQWDHSQVWMPQHTRRLLLVMAVAYGWTLAVGVTVFATGQQARPKTYADGRQERRYSLTEGLMWLRHMLRGVCDRVQVYLAFDTLEFLC